MRINLLSLFHRLTSSRFSAKTLDRVYNYLPINEHLVTSGQPSEDQFMAIAEAGFNRVINLAPPETENSLDNEDTIVGLLGMEYINIPVNFKNPTEQDFELFCDLMQRSNAGNTWVHCAANMRVSAFIYRYRTQVLCEDTAIAQSRLEQVWEPFGVWKKFVNKNVELLGD